MEEKGIADADLVDKLKEKDDDETVDPVQENSENNKFDTSNYIEAEYRPKHGEEGSRPPRKERENSGGDNNSELAEEDCKNLIRMEQKACI